MNKLMQGIERFWKEEEGTEVVEWALVAGLIVAVGAAIFATIGGQVEGILTNVSNVLATADGGAVTQ
jgi:pilus assembly protein Flp/PilA